jgi:serine/threonine-protein kinase
MATVYLAEDLKHDRKVALKVLKPELAAVLGADRFVVEIKTTASLQHPHILPLFDSGNADGFLYYVMPFIDGETLREKLNRETQLGVDQAVRIAGEVGDALQYAHDRGVIHRDIKPENILLANGRAMVADFGIALAVSAAAGGRMTETGLSLGTPHYMSPEQATADRDITSRSDIYSLASVLYEMLAGVPPHEGGSAQQTIMRIITETPRPLNSLRKSVPPHVEAAVMRALEKLPADRFVTASEFVSALTNSSTLAWHDPSRLQPFQSGIRGRRWITWASIAVALLMTGIAAYAWSMSRSSLRGPRAPLRYVLATTGGEDMQALSISADGGTVAYSATVNGIQRAYVRQLDQLDPVLLPGAEGVFNLALEPDGRAAVIADARRQLRLVPLDGSAPTSLATTTIPAGISWSSSHGVVLGMPAFSDSLWGLMLVPNGADSMTVLTNPRPRAMHHDPLVLSDGATVLYVEIPTTGSNRGASRLGIGNLANGKWQTTDLPIGSIIGFANGILLYRDGGTIKAVRLDTQRQRVAGKAVVIEGVPSGVDAAVMASNGTLVMHTVSSNYQLELVNDRGEGEAVLADTISHVFPRVSPDGSRAVLVANVKPSSSVWMLDLSSRTVSGLGFRRTSFVDWTPDGHTLAAVSPGQGIRTLSADATPDQEPAQFPNMQGFGLATPLASISISPDGKLAVLGTAFGSGFDLILRHLDGDTAKKVILATGATEIAPRFAPDGRWLAYSSDESGRQEVYVQPFPGPGRRVQVSAGGGEQPVWSADGRLFYRTGTALMVAELSRSGDVASVGSRRKLFDGDFFGIGEWSATYDVLPDGRHFLMARRVGAAAGQLIVWVDWLGDIEAKLAAGS